MTISKNQGSWAIDIGPKDPLVKYFESNFKIEVLQADWIFALKVYTIKNQSFKFSQKRTTLIQISGVQGSWAFDIGPLEPLARYF